MNFDMVPCKTLQGTESSVQILNGSHEPGQFVNQSHGLHGFAVLIYGSLSANQTAKMWTIPIPFQDRQKEVILRAITNYIVELLDSRMQLS